MPGRHLLAVQAAEDGQMRTPPRRHPYNEYTWELNQINPWLSACDLAGPAPADLQGTCGPPAVPKKCPGACARNEGPGHFDHVIEMLERILDATGAPKPRRRRRSELERAPDAGTTTEKRKKKQQKREAAAATAAAAAAAKQAMRASPMTKRAAPEQCLFYLEESHKRDVCREDFGRSGARSFQSARENRYWFMSGLRLRHCCEHAAVNALAPGRDGPLEAVLVGGPGCVQALDKLLLVDALAARLHCEFEEVLARYDCSQTYSVIHNCNHCKEAYRKWVCSSLVPYFAHGGPLNLEPSEESWTGRRIRPCRSLCQNVEQRCPYLLPGDRAPAYPTQYAGEPTFLCRDPNIPETGEQAARALHPNTESECCFDVCSEEEPALGICPNCTNKVPYIGPKYPDPPTAPQCDIASLPGQQQQPPRQQSSLCGRSGISAILATYFAEQPASSPAPDTSGESSSTLSGTSLGATATSASSSASSVAASSPVPLLCLFWLWGVLFSSQCSVRCLLGLVDLADRCLRALRATCDRGLPLLLLALPQARRLQSRRLAGRSAPSQRHNVSERRCLLGASSPLASLRSAVIVLPSMSTPTTLSGQFGAVVGIAERRSRRRTCHCYPCCCHYCYRWWLWPSRWKSEDLWLSRSSGCPDARGRGGGGRGRCYRYCCCCRWRRRRCCCCCWCYWRCLWPCRWKSPMAGQRLRHRGRRSPATLPAFRGQQRPLWPRKKRRRKVRFGASCCRELDLVRSTSWCREPS